MDKPPRQTQHEIDVHVRAGARSLLHTAQTESYPVGVRGTDSEGTAVRGDKHSQGGFSMFQLQKQEMDRITQGNSKVPTKIIKLTGMDLMEGKTNDRYKAKQESFLSTKVKSEMNTPQRDSRTVVQNDIITQYPLQQSQTSTVRVPDYPQNFTNLEMPVKHVDLSENNNLDMFSKEASLEIQNKNQPVRPEARPSNRVSRASRASRLSKMSSKSRRSPPTRMSGSKKNYGESEYSEQPSISPIRAISGLQEDGSDEQPYEGTSEVMKKSPPQEVQMRENEASSRNKRSLFHGVSNSRKEGDNIQRKVVTGESGTKQYLIEDKDLVPGSKIGEVIGTYHNLPSNNSPSQVTEKSHDFMYPANHIYKNKEGHNPIETPSQKIKQRLEYYLNPPEASPIHRAEEPSRPITSLLKQGEYDNGAMFQNVQLRRRYSALANSQKKEKRSSKKRVARDPVQPRPSKTQVKKQMLLFQNATENEEVISVKEKMNPVEAAARTSAFVQRQQDLERKKQERILRKKKEIEEEKEKLYHPKPNIKRSQHSFKSAGHRIPSQSSSKGSHYQNDLKGPILGEKSNFRDLAASEGKDVEAPSLGKSIRSNSLPQTRAHCASQGLNSPGRENQIQQDSEEKICRSDNKSPQAIPRPPSKLSHFSLNKDKDGESTPKPNPNPPTQSPVVKPSKPIQLRIHSSSRTGYVTYQVGNQRPSNSTVQKVFTNSSELLRKKRMMEAAMSSDPPSTKKPKYKPEGNIFDRLYKQPQLRKTEASQEQLTKLMLPHSSSQKTFVSPVNSKVRRVAGGTIRPSKISEMVMNIKQNEFLIDGGSTSLKQAAPTPTSKASRLHVPTQKYRSPSEKTYQRLGRAPTSGTQDLLRTVNRLASQSERPGGHGSQFSEKSIDGRQKSEQLRSPRSSRFNSTMMTKTAQAAPSSTTRQQKLSTKTERIILQKFNREFSLGLLNHIYPSEDDPAVLLAKPLPLNISFRAYKAVLSAIGCLSVPIIQEEEPGFNKRGKEPENLQHLTAQARKQATREWQLQNNLFDYLLKVQRLIEKSKNQAPNAQGEELLSAQERIPTGDLKLALLAIFGIKGNKRLGLINPEKQEVANLNKDLEDKNSEVTTNDDSLEIGWILKEEGKPTQLCLSPEDVIRLQKLYGLFNVTRIAFKGQSMRTRRLPPGEEKKCTFKPNISASANSLTRRRQGSLSSSARKTTAVQKLIDKSGFSAEKRQVSTSREKNVTLSNECTFRPDIRNSQKKIRSRAPSYSQPVSQRNDSRKNSVRSIQKTEPAKVSSRFEQLYQQSLVKKRAVGLAEEKARKYTDKELQRKECTFKPKINQYYTSPNRKPLVRATYSSTQKNIVSPILSRSPRKKFIIPEPPRLDVAKPSTQAKQLRTSESAPFIPMKKVRAGDSMVPAVLPTKEDSVELSKAINLQDQDGHKMTMKETIRRISEITDKLNPLNTSTSTKRHSKVNASLRESKPESLPPHQELPPSPHPQSDKGSIKSKEASNEKKTIYGTPMNMDIFPMQKKEVSPVLQSFKRKATPSKMLVSGSKAAQPNKSLASIQKQTSPQTSPSPSKQSYRPEIYGRQDPPAKPIKPVLNTRPSATIEVLIDESQGLKDSLVYYPGDDPREVSINFCDKHGLGKPQEDDLFFQLQGIVERLKKNRKQEKGERSQEDRMTPAAESKPSLDTSYPTEQPSVKESSSSLKNLLERENSGKFKKRRETNGSGKQGRGQLMTPEPNFQGPPIPKKKATEPSIGSIDLIKEVEDDEVKIEEQFNVRFSEGYLPEEEEKQEEEFEREDINAGGTSQNSEEEPHHYNLYQKSEGGEPNFTHQRRRYQ